MKLGSGVNMGSAFGMRRAGRDKQRVISTFVRGHLWTVWYKLR